MIADTLGSYGSLARFKNVPRIERVNESTLIGAGGEYSDFQLIKKLLEQLKIQDFAEDDGGVLTPKEIYNYLSRVLYNRRSRINPLWNSLVIAGFDKTDTKEGNSFLGTVDLYGSTFEENYITTGYGKYMALPIIRKHWRPDLSESEAKSLLEEAMTVLFYRDCRTINKFQLAKVTKDGTATSQPYALSTKWDYELFVNPEKP